MALRSPGLGFVLLFTRKSQLRAEAPTVGCGGSVPTTTKVLPQKVPANPWNSLAQRLPQERRAQDAAQGTVTRGGLSPGSSGVQDTLGSCNGSALLQQSAFNGVTIAQGKHFIWNQVYIILLFGDLACNAVQIL